MGPGVKPPTESDSFTMSKARHNQKPHPRQVSEATFSWLKGISAGRLAAQVASWQPEQWTWVRTAMLVHGIAPLLYQTLRKQLAWNELPASLKKDLREYYELNGQRLAILMAELHAILEATRQAGIPILPLKGAALTGHYYEDPALRPMADLDFLVPPGDQGSMGALLRELGYQKIRSAPRHQRYLLTRRNFQVACTQSEHPDNPYLVEVHPEVEEEYRGLSYRITGDLWAGSAPALFGGTPGLLVKPWALLQHLLVHASRDLMDHRARLIQLYDISLVMPRLDRSDWKNLRQAAERRGTARWLYAPLRLMERYLGRPAPHEVMAYLRQDTPARLRLFLERTDLYTVSYLNPFPKSLIDTLSWHRSGRELLVAVRHLVLPPAQDPRLLSQNRPLLTALVVYGWRQMRGILGTWLRLPQHGRTRILPDGHR